MKQAFMKEKGKKEMFNFEPFPITIPRQFEEKFYILKTLLVSDDRSNSSHSSDCSSPEEEVKGQAVEKIKKKVSENTRERDEPTAGSPKE